MMNYEMVNRGMQIVVSVLAPYLARELGQEYGSKVWWREGVMKILRDEQKARLPEDGEWQTLVDSLDAQRCLLLLDLHWNNIFRKKLTLAHRSWIKELQEVRRKCAHIGGEDFSIDYACRALDTMSMMLETMDLESSDKVRALYRELRFGTAEGSGNATETPVVIPEAKNIPQPKASTLLTSPYTGLPSWRQVIQPHQDVAEGRYRNAEFAADLAQVARGEGSVEYRDPVEFFSRTFVTEGMKGLLKQSIMRVTEQGGEPVIQLKTAFGGGKTHSMLAIYHMMRRGKTASQLPSVGPLLAECGVTELPEVHVAVIVGTALDPTKKKVPANMPGITISTIWGEMAYQLALSCGKPELYNYIKESDKRGVSPGSETLQQLFDACGYCVILIDELVAYARKLYVDNGLAAGTFENQLSFIQEITEAAKASKNSLVIASIPESNTEIGGEAGQKALEAIEHTFGRLESIWKPVAANEGFEVVRRRLFLECRDPGARSAVCQKFSDMYLQNSDAFPHECREVEYRDRLESCYPFHPEVFDRLYEEWATLEHFQKTRGVLRLMAALVHNLWINQDNSLLIMPGSLTLDDPAVRDELIRYLDANWNPIVDNEVDGKHSVPYSKDNSVSRYGSCMAARRVARTIMLGSAPSTKEQSLRGIEKSHVLLGSVQPGENIAVFNDALGTLQSSLAYLYSNPDGNRFWYDTRPTLRKAVEDRATQFKASEVDYEIEQLLHSIRKEPPFGGVHICPAASLDVPDEQTVRLVILAPNQARNTISGDNHAVHAAEDILNNRGSAPRIYRNMLVFVAPSADGVSALRDSMRKKLAWESVQNDRDVLGLDAQQVKDTANNLARARQTVDARMKEAYCWLLAPRIDKDVDVKTIVWEEERLSGGEDTIPTKAQKKLFQQEMLINQWAPSILKMTMDNNSLWKERDHVKIKDLWEYFTTYCYLPRLANSSVLSDCIMRGVSGKEYFAYAEGFDGTRYTGLAFNKMVGVDCNYGYLVQLQPALIQIAAEQLPVPPAKPGDPDVPVPPVVMPPQPGQPGTDSAEPNKQPPPMTMPKHFAVTAHIDNTRVMNDVRKLYDEIISQLGTLDGCATEITLQIEATVDGGIDASTARTLTENCRTLKTGQPELY